MQRSFSQETILTEKIIAEKIMTHKIGYARVSTVDQNLEAQVDLLNNAGCSKIFLEKISSRKESRPELTKMLEYVRPGDTVIVTGLDRLARSLKELIALANALHSKQVEFRSLKENIDTNSSAGRMIFHIFGAIAEFERELISERTKAGISAARARGRKGGRPNKLSEKDILMLKALHNDKTIPIQDLMNRFNICKSTLYRLLEN